MTLENIYYMGQTIAVAALLISLLFVGYQIHQNTKAIKATSHHAITDSFNQINALMISDPACVSVWRRGLSGLENLDEDERISFGFMNLAYARIFETLFYQYENGTMDKKLFDAELASLKMFIRYPGFRQWWSENPISLSTEYRAFVGNVIADAEMRATE